MQALGQKDRVNDFIEQEIVNARQEGDSDQLTYIADRLEDLGKLDRAIELYQEALALVQKNSTQEPFELLEILIKLATLYHDRGEI